MINADKKKEMKNLSEMLLETRNLTKQYGHHKAVDSVNMHIKKGTIYGFIGRNGAGKTTCLKMISGLSKPTCGEIEMFGYKGKDLQEVRSRIGCLIEAPGLYGNMTAYENLNIKCKLFGIKKKSYIEEILRIIGLEDVGKKKTKHFSLGMKQRLGIGLALVGEPDLLVLDEPINGLDPQGIAEIRDTIQRLQKEKNMTICISSHILEELSKIATDYGIIHNGSLLQEITREELIRRCSERIELTLDHPKQAIPVMDSMGFTNYQVTDKEHIYKEEGGEIFYEFVKYFHDFRPEEVLLIVKDRIEAVDADKINIDEIDFSKDKYHTEDVIIEMLSGYCNRTLLPEAVELMCEYVEKKQSAIDTVMQCIKTNYSIDKNAYKYDYFTVNMIVL